MNSIKENTDENVEGENLIQDTIVENVNEFNFDPTTKGEYESTAMIDKDYQRRFGRLYKTFDVRYVKRKMWESIDQVG